MVEFILYQKSKFEFIFKLFFFFFSLIPGMVLLYLKLKMEIYLPLFFFFFSNLSLN